MPQTILDLYASLGDLSADKSEQYSSSQATSHAEAKTMGREMSTTGIKRKGPADATSTDMDKTTAAPKRKVEAEHQVAAKSQRRRSGGQSKRRRSPRRTGTARHSERLPAASCPGWDSGFGRTFGQAEL